MLNSGRWFSFLDVKLRSVTGALELSLVEHKLLGHDRRMTMMDTLTLPRTRGCHSKRVRMFLIPLIAGCVSNSEGENASSGESSSANDVGSSDASSAEDPASSSGSESTGSGAALECVLAGASQLNVLMSPGADSLPDEDYVGECTLTSLDTSSATLACPVDDDSIDVTLNLDNFAGDLSTIATTGDLVLVRYSTALPAEIDPAPKQMTWRRAGDQALLLVAADVAAPHAFPMDIAPLELAVIQSTDCADGEGSCGLGAKRRVAIEAALAGEGAVAVFDGNSAVLGEYLFQVGAALMDEGNCDGRSETRYTFVAVGG